MAQSTPCKPSKPTKTKNKELVTISETNGEKILCTTSLRIAQFCKKEHKHILRDIENLLETKEFTESNFGLSEYIDSTGRKLKMYLLDETFTSVLLMGFNGKNAIKWKIAYAKEFQRMAKHIIKENIIKRETYDYPSELNEALNFILIEKRKELGKETKTHHYMAMAGNINEIAFGDRGNKQQLRRTMNLKESQRLNRTLSTSIKAVYQGKLHKKELVSYIDEKKVLEKLS
jgi:Rha family phage regulatory protein